MTPPRCRFCISDPATRDLNRKAILIELNAEYIKIAKERLRLNEQLGAFA